MNMPEPKILKKGTPPYGAYKKGYLAAQAGKELIDCPYQCTSFYGKRFRTCWINGWQVYQVTTKLLTSQSN